MALVLQPAFDLQARMKIHNFKGDHDLLVDRLIAASQRKEVAVECLQERTLVPFFDSSEASATSFQALQPGRRPAASKPMPVPATAARSGGSQQQQAHHGLKRNERSSTQLSGSPPKKESQLHQAKHQRGRGSAKPATSTNSAKTHVSGGGAGSGAHSDGELTSARKPRGGSGKKHQRQEAAPAPKAAGSAGSQRQSPPRKRPEHLDMHQLAAASAAAGAALRTPGKAAAPAASLPYKFAGPAFTNSPTPDSLPIPTSSLLLQEAADSLRSRLTL